MISPALYFSEVLTNSPTPNSGRRTASYFTSAPVVDDSWYDVCKSRLSMILFATSGRATILRPCPPWKFASVKTHSSLLSVPVFTQNGACVQGSWPDSGGDGSTWDLRQSGDDLCPLLVVVSACGGVSAPLTEAETRASRDRRCKDFMIADYLVVGISLRIVRWPLQLGPGRDGTVMQGVMPRRISVKETGYGDPLGCAPLNLARNRQICNSLGNYDDISLLLPQINCPVYITNLNVRACGGLPGGLTPRLHVSNGRGSFHQCQPSRAI